jgi:hypothetical protein
MIRKLMFHLLRVAFSRFVQSDSPVVELTAESDVYSCSNCVSVTCAHDEDPCHSCTVKHSKPTGFEFSL